jgi:F420-non-reducing hydrogenase small subunit
MKPKVAFYWCASCGGCEEAVLDLDEELLGVADAVDIVFWPVALDFKEKDVAAMPDGSILASFINGAIRNSHQQEMAELLRAKSQVVVAFGICAQLGGIPGLANLTDAKGIFAEVYRDGVTPVRWHRENGYSLSLPEFFDTVVALDRVIEVDYYVPGCPPTPNIVRDAVHALLAPELPPKGTVLAPDHALCEQCPRKDSRPEKLLVKEFKRPHQVVADQQTCLLASAATCLAPAASAGPAVSETTAPRLFPRSLRSSNRMTRVRSRRLWKRFRTRLARSIAIACRLRCWAGGEWSDGYGQCSQNHH